MIAERAPFLRRVAGVGVTAVIVVAAGLWLLLLRPTALGGSTAYVVVGGDSMLPTYAAGDLVLAQPAAAYGPGSIVVFRVPAGAPGEGRLVIHRIHGGDPSAGYTTAGDNNSYTDPWHPTEADIAGSPSIVVPAGGRLIAFLRTPLVAALIASLATMLWLWKDRRTRALGYNAGNATIGTRDRVDVASEPGQVGAR